MVLFPSPHKRPTRRQSQRRRLSRLLLTQETRQPPSWLIFDVGRSKMKFVFSLLLMSFFGLPLSAGDATEVNFWRWFQKNEGRLFSFEKDSDRIFGDLSEEMK